MINATSRKKYRLFLLMLSVVIPGLIISGFGILAISQQQKAKELKIEEKYLSDLELIRNKLEEEIQKNTENVFQQLLKKQIQMNQPDSIQQSLKEIIIKNPIVKFPFLIDTSGKFIFPVSKKSTIPIVKPSFSWKSDKKTHTLYREGERLEFREKKIGRALKSYVKCLKKNDTAPLKPYILNAIARCYFKLGKYPQAVSYYESIPDIYSRVSPLKKDYSLYFQVLRQIAQSHHRLGQEDMSMRRYLHLYDEILQYETSNQDDKFAFFKNEALEYLNQYINVNPPTNVRRKEQGKLSKKPDRLQEFAGMDISLRWRYFEFDNNSMDDKITKPSPENKDIYRFMKIREFYMYTDEKTQFYKSVQGIDQWETIGASTMDMQMKTIKVPGTRDKVAVVMKRLPGNSSIFFGFMISPEFIHSDWVMDIFSEWLDNRDLQLLILPKKDRSRILNEDITYRFPLQSVSFERFLPDKILVLYSRQNNFFIRKAREEIRLNYLLISAFFLALILGIYLFYKYLSREAELARLKSQFTDRASHTLKTPLTRIRMLAEKLKLGWIANESKKQEYLETILSESDRMNEMITNMLDFSRIEAGKKQYNFEIASLQDLVKEVLESYIPHIKNLGFQLEVEIPDNIPSFLLDADAIRLMIINLLQNSVKYSINKKSIFIRLYRQVETVVLEVEDIGIGIDKNDINKIFQQFYRVSGDTVQAIEGSGLGLFLVQHAVQAHKGKVEVISEPEKGSRFKIMLPIKGILSKRRKVDG